MKVGYHTDAIIGPKAYDLMNGAFALMAKGDRAAAMVLIGQAKLEAGSINLGWVERWECLQNSLADIENGTIGPEQFAATMESCTNSSGGRRVANDRGGAIEEVLEVFNSGRYQTGSSLICYPNPANKIIYVSIKDMVKTAGEYEIYSSRGVVVSKARFLEPNFMIKLDLLSSGIYCLLIKSKNTTSKKEFIKY